MRGRVPQLNAERGKMAARCRERGERRGKRKEERGGSRTYVTNLSSTDRDKSLRPYAGGKVVKGLQGG